MSVKSDICKFASLNRPIKYFILPFLLSFFLISNAPANEIKNISFSSLTIQGELFLVSFEIQNGKNIFLKFRNAETPCYKQTGNEWNCLAGIPADAKPEKEKFGLFSDEKLIYKGKIKIFPASFPTEKLNLTEEKKSLYSQKGRGEEVQIIRNALKTETKEKLWNEPFSKPLELNIESVYGEKRILDGKLLKSFHRGTDLGAPEGAPIRSINNGKVILAGEFSQEGNMVMVDHGQGIISAYLHLSEISAKKDQIIKRGEIVGKVGSTGISNTPHLHLGLYLHGTPIDPLYGIKNIR